MARIQQLLDVHEANSGQGINKLNTRIFISLNTCRVIRDQIIELARVSLCNNRQEKHLRLFIMVGINKYQTFEVIKDKVWAQVGN